jgi:membrane-associated phospholipid phosphatase
MMRVVSLVHLSIPWYDFSAMKPRVVGILERAIFRGPTTAWSERAAFWIVNTLLVFGLFFVLTQIFLYRWTGSLYTEGEGFRLDGVFGGLDNRIPFIPQMALFYLFLYYPWTFLTMLYFTFIDYRWGPSFGLSLLLVGFISVAIYAVFPVSVYWWRRELLAEPLAGNVWAELMYRFYERDTSFNCFPSLHAAKSTVVAFFWLCYCRMHTSRLRVAVAAGSVILAAGVVLSTLFVKQHYIVDEIAGIGLAIAASWAVVKLCRPDPDTLIGRSCSRRPRDTHPACGVSRSTWPGRRSR